MIHGKDKSHSVPKSDAAASIHNQGFLSVRLAMRCTACNTSAVTAGLSPHSSAWPKGWWPHTV